MFSCQRVFIGSVTWFVTIDNSPHVACCPELILLCRVMVRDMTAPVSNAAAATLPEQTRTLGGDDDAAACSEDEPDVLIILDTQPTVTDVVMVSCHGPPLMWPRCRNADEAEIAGRALPPHLGDSQENDLESVRRESEPGSEETSAAHVDFDRMSGLDLPPESGEEMEMSPEASASPASSAAHVPTLTPPAPMPVPTPMGDADSAAGPPPAASDVSDDEAASVEPTRT